MNCQELLPILDALVDAELDEAERAAALRHMESCPACQRAHLECVRVKRLVQRKCFQPAIPGCLPGRILAVVRRRAGASASPGRRFETVLGGVAAALLIVVLGWVFVAVFQPSRMPLAHADAMREVARQFRCFRIDQAGESVTDATAALAAIRRSTGVRLEALPDIPGARILAWKPARLFHRPCVMLTYEDVDCGEKPAAPGPFIIVFALPKDGIDAPHDLDFCGCLTSRCGTIYCFTQADTFLNVVSSMPRADLAQRMATMRERAGRDLRE